MLKNKKMSTDEKMFLNEMPKEPIKNRRQRRAEARVSNKPVNNNRKQTKAREGNRLYLKMAAFAMSVTDKRMKAKYGY